jgi:uncharacterized protein YdaT
LTEPTIPTTEELIRAIRSERDYVDGQVEVLIERLRAIDVATRLLNETINRTPTDIQKETSHLRELMQVEFTSVAKQFAERDTRSERESRDNKLAVDAAFAAQEKQARAQNESNTEAIRKSEVSTSETIKTNQELAMTKIESLDKLLTETRLAVSQISSVKQGVSENVNDRRASSNQIMAMVGIGISTILGLSAIVISILRG